MFRLLLLNRLSRLSRLNRFIEESCHAQKQMSLYKQKLPFKFKVLYAYLLENLNVAETRASFQDCSRFRGGNKKRTLIGCC